MAQPPTFPLLVIDDKRLLEFFWSVAYTYATLQDLDIITERNVFNIPGPIGNAQRVGSRSNDDRNQVIASAGRYYAQLVEGFRSRLSQGPGQVGRYVDGVAARREQLRDSIQQVFARVDGHNSRTFDMLSAAAMVANTTKNLAIVVMATATTVVTVTGGVVAAAPLALIYLGAKVTTGLAPIVLQNASAWDTSVGVAIGKYENGAISVGEGSQKVVDYGMAGLSATYRDEMAHQIRQHRSVLVGLGKDVEFSTKRIVSLMKQRGQQSIINNQAANTYKRLLAERTALEAEKQALAKTTMMSTLKTGLVSRGIPIAFLVQDILGAYNDWYDTQRLIDRTY
ncbi:hypothetical protein [Sphingomonas sp.]|uniref:hypothetical protein n=1 Tax=Sphingomonas sp. TaxID=28214 RepID=UPI003CC62BDB